MRVRDVFVIAALGLCPHGVEAEPAPAKAPKAASLSIPVEQYQLSNGLTVLFAEDHRLPVVAVEVRYLVGSSYERPGRSGFAHLFEHLMFQGSQNFDHEYFKPFEPVGAVRERNHEPGPHELLRASARRTTSSSRSGWSPIGCSTSCPR